MEEYCEMEACDNEAFEEVPVSVNEPNDGKRSLCYACYQAYTIGVQHGVFTAPLRAADLGVTYPPQPSGVCAACKQPVATCACIPVGDEQEADDDAAIGRLAERVSAVNPDGGWGDE